MINTKPVAGQTSVISQGSAGTNEPEPNVKPSSDPAATVEPAATPLAPAQQRTVASPGQQALAVPGKTPRATRSAASATSQTPAGTTPQDTAQTTAAPADVAQTTQTTAAPGDAAQTTAAPADAAQTTQTTAAPGDAAQTDEAAATTGATANNGQKPNDAAAASNALTRLGDSPFFKAINSEPGKILSIGLSAIPFVGSLVTIVHAIGHMAKFLGGLTQGKLEWKEGLRGLMLGATGLATGITSIANPALATWMGPINAAVMTIDYGFDKVGQASPPRNFSPAPTQPRRPGTQTAVPMT